ncbi:MAG: cob(I)yrinic acid a,c-diamide adenosyltransferase [Candidatus Wildermuthbacteria bacterium]|nr:cob(I)yrinic acid a,c-diamide adenosyltransferase [Candidatus Wildermuthbacteria bacterium]
MGFFYTGKGDAGQSLIGGKKYPKDSPIVMALGDLDELNSFLGLARSSCESKTLNKKLFAVQEDLFIIQARVAWLMFQKFRAPQMTQEKVSMLEQAIEEMEKQIDPERGFVVPGEHAVSAWLDVARAVSRRAERSIVALSGRRKIPREILAYMNRLSSYLYALARMEIAKAKIRERKPHYL